MGTDLGDLIETEEISFEHLNDRVIAVDAMNTLYQFLSIIRQPDGTPLKDSRGNVTSHLSGLFYRTTKLFANNIKVVYVYDGTAPDLKETEAAERRKRREKAEQEWKRLREEGKMKKAFQKATQSSKITGDMIDESKKMLDAMGVPHVQAPSEGEAQAAQMNAEGSVWGVNSQDWDSLLFGTDVMIRNLTITGRRKIPNKQQYREVVPERIDREAALEALGISQQQLVWIAVLVGTDFNPGGIKGIGPKTALKLVREYDSFEAITEDEKFDWDHDVSPGAIIEFIEHPPVEDDVAFSFDDPDADAVRDVLIDQHDFSEDRIASSLDTLIEARKSSQSGLGSFMG